MICLVCCMCWSSSSDDVKLRTWSWLCLTWHLSNMTYESFCFLLQREVYLWEPSKSIMSLPCRSSIKGLLLGNRNSVHVWGRDTCTNIKLCLVIAAIFRILKKKCIHLETIGKCSTATPLPPPTKSVMKIIWWCWCVSAHASGVILQL